MYPKCKVLVLVPNLKFPGGVAELYNTLRLDQYDNVDYFRVQGNKKVTSLLRFVQLVVTYFRFTAKQFSYEIIHINPSLSPKSFLRDGVFIIISKLCNKKVVVYWHGWNFSFEKKIFKDKFLRWFFSRSFLKADLNIVLGDIFKRQLINMGLTTDRIIIESNAAKISIEPISGHVDVEDKPIEVLYISRIEEAKGIFIVLNTISLLKHHNFFKFTIAGSGSKLAEANEFVKEHHLTNVVFTGYVDGESKAEVYRNSDILFFPSYSEGMPLVILEAMLCGLVIISRPIGGIPDWVEEGKNGFLIDTLEPQLFADKLMELSHNRKFINTISKLNIEKANQLFLPEKLVERLFNYYESLK